jgi:hypothetical protein
VFAACIAAIVVAWSIPAEAAAGYWRLTGYDTTPPQSQLDETDRGMHAMGRRSETRVSGAFQPAASGAGTLEQTFNNDDVDRHAWDTNLKFSFTTGIDMRTLTPGQKVRFNGVASVGGNDKSRAFGSSGSGKIAVDNGDYFVSAEAPIGQSASNSGVVEIPNGGPGSTMLIYAAGHISADGALSGRLNMHYEWVAGPAPTPTPPPPVTGDNSGGGDFTGAWRTSEGDMTLTQTTPAVSGTYSQDNGRIYAVLQGGHLVGYWAEDGSAQACPTQKLGSSYWGRIDWVLSADGRRFEGRWSYCDAEPSGSWTGERQGPAQGGQSGAGPSNAGQSNPAPATSGPSNAGPANPGPTNNGFPQSGPWGQPGLVAAPDQLGARIDVVEGEWRGTWVRRGGSGVFDATWRSSSTGAVASDVIRIEQIIGNLVILKRDSNGGRYFGALGCDGRTITGSASWYASGTTWSGTISRSDAAHRDDGEQRGPGPTIDTHGDTSLGQGSIGGHHDDFATHSGEATKFYDNWNTGGCGATDRAVLDIDRPTRLERIEIWFNWSQGETRIPYDVLSQGRVIASAVLIRGDCDPYQAAWCVAQDSPASTVGPGRYVFRLARAGVCQNGGSGGAGFIRAFGRR